ncbi:MAG TPA: glycosyltransferase [Vicinamibacterales bacterium]|jgi:glycosyltransferase involved in cell wall biosynthesis|nr:glycosyltransferase [Vicinamibacterales bacterium]
MNPLRDTQQTDLEGQIILSMSDSPWESPLSGRQRVMSRLARRNTVFYVDPPPHIEQLWKDRPRWSDLKITVSQTASGVQVIRFPRWACYSYRPSLERGLAWLRATLLKVFLRRRGGRPPILYVFHPDNWSIVQHFARAFVCYHVYDDYREFTGVDRNRVGELDDLLAGRANVLIGVSESLVADRQQLAQAAYVVHNGADYAAFADEHLLVPPDLDAIPKPRVVYVARLNVGVDFSVLEHLARDGTFQVVVVGPLMDFPQAELAEAKRVLALPNIHWLGERVTALVPAYVRHCDACLLASRLTAQTKTVATAQKLFEYLAAGKPVVSTPLPLMRQFEPAVRFASSLDDWIVQLREAIATDTPELRKQRQELAARNSWDAQVERIGRILAGHLNQPQA